MTKQFNVRLEEETIQKIEELCKMTYRSPANLIKWMVDQKHEDVVLVQSGIPVIRTLQPEPTAE